MKYARAKEGVLAMGEQLRLLDQVRVKRPRRVPAVLSRDEVTRPLTLLGGQIWLMTALSPSAAAERGRAMHANVSTTQAFTRVLNRSAGGVQGLLDR